MWPVSTCEFTLDQKPVSNCHYRGHASNRVGPAVFRIPLSNMVTSQHTKQPWDTFQRILDSHLFISMAQNENQKIALQLPNGLGITGSASPRRPISPNPSGHSGIVVFSGGSAANNLVDVFETVREANQGRLSYVIPISDNGGSSSELIRVFGGPGTDAMLRY